MVFRAEVVTGNGTDLRPPIQAAISSLKPKPSALYAMAIREADRHNRAGNFNLAAQVMESFLQDEPGSIGARIRLAQAHLGAGDLEKAEHAIAPARKECLGNQRLHKSLMNAYVDTGRFDEAKTLLDQAPSSWHYSIYSIRRLLDHFLEAKRPEESKTVLSKVFQKDWVDPHDMRKTMRLSMGAGTPEATADFIIDSSSCCIQRTRKRILSTAIEIFGEMKQPDCAARIFNAGAECIGADKDAWESMLRAYSDAGRVDKAGEIFSAICSGGFAGSSSYSSMIKLYARCGHMDNAEALFEKAWNERNDDGYPLRDAMLAASMMMEHSIKEDFEKTKAAYEMAIDAGISSCLMHSVMIRFSAKSGHAGYAEQAYTNAIGRDEMNARLLCEAVCAFANRDMQDDALKRLVGRCDREGVHPKVIVRMLHDMQVRKDFDGAHKAILSLPARITDDLEVRLAITRLTQTRKKIDG